ncbi:hypothetical protein JTB14_001820 [Gonioctena quinquepunctata]|nr:hypothetical protein JTB14_001820 [Gonioctena quinquepunctata]
MNPDSVSAQVPDIADGVSESTKASTTEVQTITSRKKTHAQRCREYRERKKLQNTMVQNITAERSDDQLQAKKPKTNAERRKKHYEAQKLKKQKSKKIPKTVKQKNKEYYERKKKIRALNTLNHHSDAGGANMLSEHYEKPSRIEVFSDSFLGKYKL